MSSTVESASLVKGVATRQTFSAALELLVGCVFNISEDKNRNRRALELYPNELQQFAADKARVLEISAAAAAVFFIFSISRHQLESIGFWSRVFSAKSKALHRNHDAMLEIDNVLLRKYSHDPISGYLNIPNKAALRRYADAIRAQIGAAPIGTQANASR